MLAYARAVMPAGAAGRALQVHMRGLSGRMLRCGASPNQAVLRRPRASAPQFVVPGSAHFGGLASSNDDGDDDSGRSETAAAAPAEVAVAGNRWKYLPVCFASGLPFGAYYSWSVFQGSLTKQVGVLAQASTDWDLSQTLPVFTVNGVMLAVGAIALGTWIDKVGARKALRLGAVVWPGAMLTAAAGAHLHEISLIYASMGVVGGLGLSLGYLSSIAFIQKWFPDRRALAAGVSVAGFGGGSIVAAPVGHKLLSYFREPPQYVGDLASGLHVKLQDGAQVADVSGNGEWQEVVLAKAYDVAAWNADGAYELAEGFYLAGTGDSGVVGTFATLGIGYGVVAGLASIWFDAPPEGWKPAGWKPSEAELQAQRFGMHPNNAVRTPQYGLSVLTVFGYALAGFILIPAGGQIMTETFKTQLPELVTPAFATAYVTALATANLGGRLLWGQLSDVLGRRACFNAIGALGATSVAAVPLILHHLQAQLAASSAAAAVAGGTAAAVAADASASAMLPMAAFVASTCLTVSLFGGVFAVLPSHTAGAFGAKYMAGITGRMLLGSGTAVTIGPHLLAWNRERSIADAIADLAGRVDAAAFEDQFGVPLSQLDELVAAKVVGVPDLMALCPPGTLDPTFTLLDNVLYIAAGSYVAGLVAYNFIRPIDPAKMDRH